MKNIKKSKSKIKLIYNPRAGSKRRLLSPNTHFILEDIKDLFEQYQLEVDYFATKRPHHATELAKEAVKEGYEIVVAAGGDGTVSEVANGLINTDIKLGILPLGSFMNTAKMLSIPHDLEKAVMMIKLDRTRKIDVGEIIKLSGEKMSEPSYFLESAGIGLDAEIHEHILEWEHGDYKALFKIFQTFRNFYGHKGKITLDGTEIETNATMVNISNGPMTGAALPIAPKAKLNDHKLTIRLYKMSKFQLIKYFFKAIKFHKTWSPKIETYQTTTVKIDTKIKRKVHADASLFGTTPVEFRIVPNALNVLTGFPKPDEVNALEKRTVLDP